MPQASVVAIPDGVTLEQASTLPMNGLTAKLGLELLGLQPGQTLAVTGGAGLLASYVIPLAKELGLRVIADAKPEDEPLVRSFGADVVVLARRAASSRRCARRRPSGVDGLYDTALLHETAFGAIRDAGGMVVVRGWKPSRPSAGSRSSRSWSAQRSSGPTGSRSCASSHPTGRLQLRVAGEYPPEQAAEAQRIMDAGGLRGRVVIVF